jgi:hypothetical protein
MFRMIFAAIMFVFSAATAFAQAPPTTPTNTSAQERQVLKLLESNPELSKAIYRKLRTKYDSAAATRTSNPTPSSTDIFVRGIRQNSAALGEPTAPAQEKAATDGEQRLFIRKDSIDTFL